MLPKKPTWKRLKGIVRKGHTAINNYMQLWPRTHRKAVALALSLAHWAPSERDWLWKDFPRHVDSKFCALCSFIFPYCNYCPLKTCKWGSLLHLAVCNRSDYYADKLYNKLIKLYAIEWKKL